MFKRLPDDPEIINAYFDRDSKAIDWTAKKYGRFIYSVCYRLLGQKQDCEECQNETYLRAWESIPPARPGDLKLYLARLARGIAVDHFRRENRQKRIGAGLLESLDDYSDILSDDRSVSDEAEANELAAIINGFLAALTERERACFVKRYYFAYSIREIEEQTGIPRSTVADILTSLKERLKEILIKEGYFEE